MHAAEIEVTKDLVSQVPGESGTFNLVISSTSSITPTSTFFYQQSRRRRQWHDRRADRLGGQEHAARRLVHCLRDGRERHRSSTTTPARIVCVNRGTSVQRGTTLPDGSVRLDVRRDDDIVCTITNTRKAGSIELRKFLNPSGDPGLFNLFIKNAAGTTVIDSALNVGNAGTTGANVVPPGTYTLEETAGTNTSLSNYSTTLQCVNTAAGNAPVTVTNNQVNVVQGATVRCDFVNSRLTGTLRVVKTVAGPTPGNTNWSFNATGPTPNSTTIPVEGAATVNGAIWPVNTGNYAITETVGAGTDGSLFNTTVSCSDGSGTASNGGRTISGVTVATAENVVCTFVNTRKSGSIELRKALSPTNDPGKFNLTITGLEWQLPTGTSTSAMTAPRAPTRSRPAQYTWPRSARV